jgi:hypothetical protein
MKNKMNGSWQKAIAITSAIGIGLISSTTLTASAARNATSFPRDSYGYHLDSDISGVTPELAGLEWMLVHNEADHSQSVNEASQPPNGATGCFFLTVVGTSPWTTDPTSEMILPHSLQTYLTPGFYQPMATGANSWGMDVFSVDPRNFDKLGAGKNYHQTCDLLHSIHIPTLPELTRFICTELPSGNGSIGRSSNPSNPSLLTQLPKKFWVYSGGSSARVVCTHDGKATLQVRNVPNYWDGAHLVLAMTCQASATIWANAATPGTA